MNDSIINDYLNITKKNVEKFGENTILLMQVGAFFEIYGIKDKNERIYGSKIAEICAICQLNMPAKTNKYNNDTILMAGVRDYSLDKYLPKMTDAGYTVVVYSQEKEGTNVSRYLSGIYSPGTILTNESDKIDQITNNIMCIWIETIKNKSEEKIIYGISNINIFTGKSYIFEHETQYLLNPTTFDELERNISIFSPSEIIFISPFDTTTVKKIQNFIGISTTSIHNIDTNYRNEKIENCVKQTYISHILSKFFGEEAINQCQEFQLYSLASQSFCYLLDFIQEHNSNLIKHIAIPLFNNTSTRTILANHTLKQLNIIDDNQCQSNLSSVLKFLNKCCYYGGKRLFKYQLTNPCFDEEWLMNEYNLIEEAKNSIDIDNCRISLSSLPDIEKITRQLIIKKVSPYHIWQIYNSFNTIYGVIDLIKNSEKVSNKLLNNKPLKENILEINKFINQQVDLEICKKTQCLERFENNFINPGVSKELDNILQEQKENDEIFEAIYNYFNKIMRITEKDANTEFVKKHYTATNGVSLQLTKKRAVTLKSILSKKKERNIEIINSKFSLDDIKIISASSSADEITFPLLTIILKEKSKFQDKINEKVSEIFNDILNTIENNWLDKIYKICDFTSKVDVLCNKAFVAIKYNYCKPEIDSQSEQSFVKAKNIKHCLIEHLQNNEIYVTNDIHIGCEDQNGILLYGTNAVGKTSLIRALGIAVIIAQSGMYVPCSQFIYKPYTAIFSRILGNDNLFKGLSTFAVEISELRVILRMANERSLILGDEVCSGTETESALSIFVTTLMNIYNKQSSFIFATHFHEIINYEEIKLLNKLVIYHMHVIFDREQDCLIYDRKLKKGPGTRMYGLEVCKSLYLDNDFLDKAYELRRKYFPESRGELSNPTSVYNAKKVRGMCEMCNETISQETHHISHQKNANNNNYIDSFHKNSPGNLMSLCEVCHNKIHNENKKIKKKKTTKGIKIVEELV